MSLKWYLVLREGKKKSEHEKWCTEEAGYGDVAYNNSTVEHISETIPELS